MGYCLFSWSYNLHQLFVYILSPKTTYMIEHLNSKQQIDAWLNIYRTMQVKYHTGLVLGIVAAMLFAYANKC